MESKEKVSSKAVVKYEGPTTLLPSYIELAKDTDLNNPPSNWLRDNLIGSFPYESANKTEPFDYSSLLMAGRYPDIVGEVDVVAGASLIKKLLKMPFSDSSLSMSVHRIGKTLLLSQLDVPAILNSPYSNNENLAWLRDLYCEARGIPLDSEFHPKKRNKEQSQLQVILSKFMYHSIQDGAVENETSPGPESYSAEAMYDTTDVDLSKQDLQAIDLLDSTLINKPSTSYDLVKPAFPSDEWSGPGTQDLNIDNLLVPISRETELVAPVINSSELVAPINSSELVVPINSSDRVELTKNDFFAPPRDSNDTPQKDGVFSRDVLWTFEDITMLVGSNLPIFGGGKYPAVSLRLRDSSKPINILTGIDYWLDNLMCNVPELIMCFHLKGIVQKYEKIKTSDLPDIEEGSFSPKVIKDIAQNILSFLKANCTKEGHTYWLFKSSKDDVIKLYDLTSICAERTDGKQVDPFSVSVAVLLYNIARNMYASGEINSRNIVKIRSLLKNCITLLETKDRPDISLLANCLLIELYNDVEEESDGESNSFEDDSSDEIYSTDEDFGENEKASEPITSLSVKTLGSPTAVTDIKKESKAEKSIMVAINHESRCKNTISLISNSLKSINVLLYMYKVADISEGRPVPLGENVNSQLKSLHQTELNQATLAFITNDLKCFYTHSKKKVSGRVLSLTDTIQDLSLADVRILLLEKAVECHITITNINISKQKFGRALQSIQTSLYCLDNVKQMCSSSPNKYLSIEVLKLYGDVLTMMANQDINKDSEIEDFHALNEVEQGFVQLLQYDDASQFYSINIMSMYDAFSLAGEELLNSAADVYEKAVSIISEISDQTSISYQKVDLCRRLGNIRNELGVLYMNKAASITKTYGLPCDEEMSLWKRSYTLYEGAITAFKTVDDRPNMALLYLNCAKLMHLCAQVYGNSTRSSITEKRGPFTQEEKTYFNKSFEYYQNALSVLSSREDYPNIWTNVSLELSGVYFSMATTIQKNSSNQSEDKVMKEISSAFMKALHYSESVMKACKERHETMVKHRIGSIHHQLAELYCHVLKNRTSDNDKKNYRSLAELHYRKMYVFLQPDIFPMDVLCAILHYMSFFEYVLKQSFSWKYLKLRTEMFLNVKQPGEGNSTLLLSTLQSLHKKLNEQKEDAKGIVKSGSIGGEIDIKELKVLLALLDTCIKTTFKDVIKFLTQNKNRKEDFLDMKVVKSAYEIVLRGLTVKDSDVIRNLNAFINVVSSIKDLHALS